VKGAKATGWLHFPLVELGGATGGGGGASGADQLDLGVDRETGAVTVWRVQSERLSIKTSSSVTTGMLHHTIGENRLPTRTTHKQRKATQRPPQLTRLPTQTTAGTGNATTANQQQPTPETKQRDMQ
jgi:hypothetical protein